MEGMGKMTGKYRDGRNAGPWTRFFRGSLTTARHETTGIVSVFRRSLTVCDSTVRWSSSRRSAVGQRWRPGRRRSPSVGRALCRFANGCRRFALSWRWLGTSSAGWTFPRTRTTAPLPGCTCRSSRTVSHCRRLDALAQTYTEASHTCGSEISEKWIGKKISLQ